jgi:hypothetical protein
MIIKSHLAGADSKQKKNKIYLLTRFNGMDEPDDLRKHISYQMCCFTDECIFAFCVQFVFVEM